MTCKHARVIVARIRQPFNKVSARIASQPWTLRSLLAVIAIFVFCNALFAATPDVYQKRWNDKAVNDRIQANIEKYRKGEATIDVVDNAGKPVPDVLIELQQTRHAFLFGCNAFVLGQLKTPEANRQYEEAFAQLFNFVTVPLYWEGTEPSRGELRYEEGGRDIYRRPPPDRFFAFGEKYGITLKGHPLLWHSCNPDWLPKDPNELRELYRKRFREISERYGKKISIWDAVNESLVCDPKYPLLTPDRAYVAWAFREIAPLFPAKTTLLINEVNMASFGTAENSSYFAQVKSLLANDVPVRGIGFQFHYFRRAELDKHLVSPDCDPIKLLDLYEAFGEFKLPLYVTEITIPSAGPDGEALQAEVTRNYYRLWFSVPMMQGITWWNLGDNTAVEGENEAQGGLANDAMQPKAAYRELDDLINHEWKTTATIHSDAEGHAQFKGFFGKYQVKLIRGDKVQTVELDHTQSGDKNHRLTLTN
jgi:GH35 family endo-1,4-beta-xylanase